jgi:anti-sigma regulatory factor (Ser/Thr protein kinase)
VSSPAGQSTHRVAFPADPVSVPAARQVVRDAVLAWGEADLLADALVASSELATNATLHSGAEVFVLEVTRLAEGTVLMSVTDDGPVPPEAVEPRPAGLNEASGELTTGRGLGIVSAVSTQWGVDALPDGKRVWAVVGKAVAEALPQQRGPEHDRAEPQEQAPPPGWHIVRFVECPVALSLQQDDHLDELVRDLQLATGETTDGSHLAGQIRDILGRHAHARHMGRRTAQRAAAAGQETVLVEMVLPAEAAGDVADMHAAVTAADTLARQGLLLLEPSPDDVAQLRGWMTDEFQRQLLQDEEPRPFDEWRRAHLSAAG